MSKSTEPRDANEPQIPIDPIEIIARLLHRHGKVVINRRPAPGFDNVRDEVKVCTTLADGEVIATRRVTFEVAISEQELSRYDIHVANLRTALAVMAKELLP